MTPLPPKLSLNKLKTLYIKPQNEQFCKWHLSAIKQWKRYIQSHSATFIGSLQSKLDPPSTLPPRLSSLASSHRSLTLSSTELSSSVASLSSTSPVPFDLSRRVQSRSFSSDQSRSFSSDQSRHPPRSTWDTTTNLVQSLKEMTDDELLDKLDRLERINAKMRRVLKWKRTGFRPEEGTLGGRAFVVDEDAAPVTVALLVST